MHRRVLQFAWAWIVLLVSGVAFARPQIDDGQLNDALRMYLEQQGVVPKAEASCDDHCFLLSSLVIKGAVGQPLTFDLRGTVLAKDVDVRIPLFGSPSQVRLDDVTIDGTPVTMGFENDYYYVITRARGFTIHGKITLGTDQAMTVVGPINNIDARLTQGRMIEGELLSGIQSGVLHFDPMTEESKAKQKTVFRLSRALRVGKEKSFIYRLSMSSGEDLTPVHIPLSHGEKVREVSGVEGWQQDGGDLMLPISGKEADVTISGSFERTSNIRPDERSAYEWVMVEGEPDTLLTFDGDVKLVDLAQSPIPPTLPSARLFLLQRGQHLEIDGQSLVQGEALSAVVREERHFFAFTPLGEVIHDGTYTYENNGLEHLFMTPPGRAMFVSVDGSPSRIMRTNPDKPDFLIQLPTGPHRFRVQTLESEKIRWFGGLLSPELPSHMLATSHASVAMGLPENVLPIALFGGDKTQTLFAMVDLIAILIGAAAAGLGFRTRRTRILGALVVAGLWLVSHEVYVLVAATLFCVGAIFLASRFVRGSWLLVASGACVVISLIGGKVAIGIATAPFARDIYVSEESRPTPETSYMPPREGPDGKPVIVPVQLSIPVGDKYVGTTRQLVSAERPFRPRLLYVTTTTLALIELAWLALCAWLLAAHRGFLLAFGKRVLERLRHRPEPKELPTAERPYM